MSLIFPATHVCLNKILVESKCDENSKTIYPLCFVLFKKYIRLLSFRIISFKYFIPEKLWNSLQTLQIAQVGKECQQTVEAAARSLACIMKLVVSRSEGTHLAKSRIATRDLRLESFLLASGHSWMKEMIQRYYISISQGCKSEMKECINQIPNCLKKIIREKNFSLTPEIRTAQDF